MKKQNQICQTIISYNKKGINKETEEICGHDISGHIFGTDDCHMEDCSCKKFETQKSGAKEDVNSINMDIQRELDRAKTKEGCDKCMVLHSPQNCPKNNSPEKRRKVGAKPEESLDSVRKINSSGDTLSDKVIYNYGKLEYPCYMKKDVKGFIKKLKVVDGAKQIQDNLNKSFKGTFRNALTNGYEMDKHYVIVDWKFFHELLEQTEIDKLAGDKLI